jgi:hypothetical protein
MRMNHVLRGHVVCGGGAETIIVESDAHKGK